MTKISQVLRFLRNTMYSAVFVVLLCVYFTHSNGAKYSGRFDNIDIDEVLKSDRLLKNYFECLMERGPCTPEGSELRRTIPDALKSECEKCTENQKKKAGKAIQYIMDNKPKMFKELEGKYDPNGVYKARIEKNLHLTTTPSTE